MCVRRRWSPCVCVCVTVCAASSAKTKQERKAETRKRPFPFAFSHHDALLDRLLKCRGRGEKDGVWCEGGCWRRLARMSMKKGVCARRGAAGCWFMAYRG
uniref:Putative secreted peptide n=1 Tax=Anopheles braziliensis TaxID=58242 RepID=A0A2M3ZUE8_9DIPT